MPVVQPQPGYNTIQQNQTAPKYDWQNGIQRRFDIINQMGTDATAIAQDRANQKQAASLEAVRQQALRTNQQGFEFTPQSNTSTGAGGKDLRSRIVSYASQFKGTPYVWGGSKPGGFDCSGLVQYVYGKMGVKMPRVSQQQATQGRMTNVQNLKPGDLVAWGNTPASAHHIAIYAGNGMVWEAPRKGKDVRLRRISPGESGIMGISLGI